MAKDLGWTSVPCIIEEIDERTAAHRSYLHNSDASRRNLNAIEVSLHVKEMRERFGYSVRGRVNLGYATDDQTIYNKLSLLTLLQEIQNRIEAGEVSPTIGYELARNLSRSEDKECLLRSFEDLCAKRDLTVGRFKTSMKDLIDSEGHKNDQGHPVLEIFVRYPISHSLFLSVVWGLVATGFYLASRSDRTGAAVVGLLVVSHWVLDWVSHRPDMPLAPWPGTKVGLGLWNSVPATLVVELGLFAVGVWIYARTTEARDRIGIWAFAVFAGLLAAIYIGNVFGPPPPSVAALNVVAFAGFPIPVWAVWFDRHREPRIPA